MSWVNQGNRGTEVSDISLTFYRELDKPDRVEPNVATPGSLLHVCDCSIIHSYNHAGAEVSLYSTNDIRIFQTLGPIPFKLAIDGRATMKEVSQYLLDVSKLYLKLIVECSSF